MSNRNLVKARGAKNDEFYTRLSDIEKEMMHYKRHFKGKVVYCPCDDPFASQFFQYFAKNFEHLGLKRLIAACYKNTDLFRMSKHDRDEAIWLEYTGDKDGDRVPSPNEIGVHRFAGNGDFRSEESLDLLRQSDIVATNPPFSLFKDFMDVLQAERKKFLVIGNFGAVMYQNVWGYFRDGKVWVGVSPRGMDFETPERKTKSVNACWFTNLPHPRRAEKIFCYKDFDPAEYPEYDNYDAIEVSKTKNIPRDYDGVMGVPITFLEKHNPEQFELIAPTCITPEVQAFQKSEKGTRQIPLVFGDRRYDRILIRRIDLEKPDAES